jgi:hypothetical protein
MYEEGGRKSVPSAIGAASTVCWSVSNAIDSSNNFLRFVAPICANAESCDNKPKVPIGSLLNKMLIGE